MDFESWRSWTGPQSANNGCIVVDHKFPPICIYLCSDDKLKTRVKIVALANWRSLRGDVSRPAGGWLNWRHTSTEKPNYLLLFSWDLHKRHMSSCSHPLVQTWGFCIYFLSESVPVELEVALNQATFYMQTMKSLSFQWTRSYRTMSYTQVLPAKQKPLWNTNEKHLPLVLNDY